MERIENALMLTNSIKGVEKIEASIKKERFSTYELIKIHSIFDFRKKQLNGKNK